MTDSEFYEILKRYNEGDASPEEVEAVEFFYSQNQLKAKANPYASDEGETSGFLLKRRILATVSKQSQSRVRFYRRSLLKVAASVTLIIAATFWLIKVSNPTVLRPQYASWETGEGQRATVKLPDGSVVKLNALSSVSFSENYLELGSREVILTGEAFFDVERDTLRPFTVHSGALKATVLGTSFNVNAYDSTLVAVALVTGKLRVRSNADGSSGHSEEAILSPGEQALVDQASSVISVNSFDAESLLAWTSNTIRFHNSSRKQVFDQLANWYGVSFRFQGLQDQPWAYSGEFEDMSLDLVLDVIGFSQNFDFEIKDKVVSIKFKN